MADFYAEMGKMARELLAPTSAGGLGQGVIKLIHKTDGTPDPSKPWEPVEPIYTEEVLGGAVRGVGKELIGKEVGDVVIIASDRVAICEAPKQPYTAGDSLLIDGEPVHIISVAKIPEAGITAAVRFIIRG